MTNLGEGNVPVHVTLAECNIWAKKHSLLKVILSIMFITI